MTYARGPPEGLGPGFEIYRKVFINHKLRRILALGREFSIFQRTNTRALLHPIPCSVFWRLSQGNFACEWVPVGAGCFDPAAAALRFRGERREHPSGAEARMYFGELLARVQPCPSQNRLWDQ